jgi:hypothetical protein
MPSGSNAGGGTMKRDTPRSRVSASLALVARSYLGAFQPGNTTPGDAGDWLDPGSPWISFAAH